MLYKYQNKIYVKVSGNFVEVNIKKDKNGYNVIATQNKIEAYGKEKDFFGIQIEEAYEFIEKNKSKANSRLLDEE